jgi:MoaA/NifB/PqqE/SkfB family radical SAM enzyme
MQGMARTAATLVGAPSWRRWGWPRLLPLNLTISTNFRCNFKCATCNVYDRKVVELTLDEWRQVFRSIGTAPVWMTFSGGEPFLRGDLPDIILAAVEHCRPSIVNIPTNGWFTKRVVAGVERLCKGAPDTQVVINLSMDHSDPHRHDQIRGAPGSYPRLLETMAGLRALGLPNLTIGIHTVVSTENQEDFPQVARGLHELGADSYIAECAEERVELQTMESGVSPRADAFRRATTAVLEADVAAKGLVARLVRSIRVEYYDRVTRLLGGDAEAMPVCHAGFLSAHIGADGDVWSCCVLARTLGNVRDNGFDFRQVWYSAEAGAFRQWMRERRCACPLANAAYTNLLVEPAALKRVALSLLRRGRPPAPARTRIPVRAA